MDPVILAFPERDTPAPLRAQVLDLIAEAWPPYGFTGHDPALHPLSMLLVADDVVLATLDILTKPLTHAGRTYRAGGLSMVATRRSARGQGHGHHLVSAAREAMAATVDLGLFTCDRPLQPFYEAAGWSHLPGTVLVGGTPEAPFPSDHPGFDKVTMCDFFTPGIDRKAFENTRINLHPGTVDKLW
ncbi:GNAT family N-acetyltransferase [Nonomuraea sp. NPDC050556]|uniref:GNAT family N-acetyltransferase n=1 Tax=Nonomuraea sp. NPDC050556 TaxID=3364369 RepID=UPI0037AD3AC7